MDEATKYQLLEQFRTYLETYETDAGSDETTPTTDLFSLFTELAGLRNEVKLEARQFKSALDQFRTVVETLQSTQAQWRQDLDERHRQQRRETMRSMLLEMLEIYDRLEDGFATLSNFKPSRWTRWFTKHETRVMGGLKEGQAMTLRRFNQFLTRYRVRPLEVLNKPLDPHCMQAVEADSQPHLENGIVTGELRKGFLWEEELLRPAEVKVNKLEK
jgi:molecular chaperone GrpE